MVIRVSGGAITDQMLTGGLRFFKLSSAALGYFAHTTSTGTAKIPGTSIGSSNQRLLVDAQDEGDYNTTPPNGTFFGGTDYLGGVTTDDYGTLEFTATPTNTITRTDGVAFDTDGLVAGQKLTVASSQDAANNGDYTILSVTATVITTVEDIDATRAADTGAILDIFDILTLNDGTVITVDAAGTAGTGAVVTTFTVAAGAVVLQTGTTRTVSSETSGIADFTLTPGTFNEVDTGGLFVVSPGQAVPNSVADRIFREILGKATVVIINQIDDDNIHFACDDSGFGWDSPAAGDAAAEMQVAVRALGVIGGGGAASNNPPVPDDSLTGVPTRDLNVGGITITETTPFELT